jgi:hypothetical protein
MTRVLPLFLIATVGCAGSLTVGYADGTQVTIQTFSSGPTAEQAIYSSGAVVRAAPGVWHRVLNDKQGKKVVFAYDLEAGRASAPGTFVLRIKPVDEAFAREQQSAGGVPTVSAVREFNSIKLGEGIAIDLLSNPTTGEKIFDVLQPSNAAEPPKPSGEEFALQVTSIMLNGQPVKLTGVENSSLTGAAAIFYLPGHGAYFLSLESRPHFQQVAHVEGRKLWFELDNDRIEIQSKGRLLAKSENRVVWVRHDPAFTFEGTGENAGRLTQINQNLAKLQSQFAEMSKRYKPTYPAMRELQEQILQIQEQRARAGAMMASDDPVLGTADNVDWLMHKKD